MLGLQLSKIKKGKDGDQSDRRLLVIARLIILIMMLMSIILSLTWRWQSWWSSYCPGMWSLLEYLMMIIAIFPLMMTMSTMITLMLPRDEILAVPVARCGVAASCSACVQLQVNRRNTHQTIFLNHHCHNLLLSTSCYHYWHLGHVHPTHLLQDPYCGWNIVSSKCVSHNTFNSM